jgi:hypothetical protein
MNRKARWILVAVVAVWLISPMLLGSGTGGVELGHTDTSFPPQPGQLPACVSVHTFEYRNWGGWKTIQSDVWLTGCNNAEGQLRLESGPTCRATSFLGSGQATCSAAADGNKLKVVVNILYPFDLNVLDPQKATTIFWIDPGGSYSSNP